MYIYIYTYPCFFYSLCPCAIRIKDLFSSAHLSTQSVPPTKKTTNNNKKGNTTTTTTTTTTINNNNNNILWDFEIQTGHLILARRPDL